MAKETTTKKAPKKRTSRSIQLVGTINLQDLPEKVDPSIRTFWIDYMQVLTRTDVITLRFQTALPEARYEACRVQTTVVHLRNMIDVLCRTLDYYPTATKKKPAKPRK